MVVITNRYVLDFWKEDYSSWIISLFKSIFTFLFIKVPNFSPLITAAS